MGWGREEGSWGDEGMVGWMVDVDFPYNTPALDQDALFLSSNNRANDNE
jgi:hypothetical protein